MESRCPILSRDLFAQAVEIGELMCGRIGKVWKSIPEVDIGCCVAEIHAFFGMLSFEHN
jgi:hypothetical protein